MGILTSLVIKYRIMNAGGLLLKRFSYFIENTIFLKENTRDMLLGAKGPTEVHEDIPKAIAVFLGDDVQIININVEEVFV